MTAMIDQDVMTYAEIREAERDAWYDTLCDDCGHPGRDHDDGECPPRPMCSFCCNFRYYYPSQDPADPPELCPVCMKE